MDLKTLEIRAVRTATGRALVGDHELVFAEPRPIWPGAGGPGAAPALQGPVILRYRSDDFMDRFLREVASEDGPGWVPLQAEADAASWDADDATRLLEAPPRAPGVPDSPPWFKLFQPFHGHFHLVACSFLCRQLGFPDRRTDPAKGESLSFVVRRRRSAADAQTGITRTVEEAWVPGAGWSPARKEGMLVPVDGEERLPLIPVRTGAGRRVYCGYLPVTSKDTYEVSEDDPLSPASELEGARLPALESDLEELKGIGRQEALDFGLALRALLGANVPAVRRSIDRDDGESVPPDPLPVPEQEALVGFLESTAASPLSASWKSIVRRARQVDEDPGLGPSEFGHELVRVTAAARADLRSALQAARTGPAWDWSAYDDAESDLVDAREERWEKSLAWTLDLEDLLRGTLPEAADALERAFAEDDPALHRVDPAKEAPEMPWQLPDPDGPPELEGPGASVVDALWATLVEVEAPDGTHDDLVLARALWLAGWIRRHRIAHPEKVHLDSGADPADFDPASVSVPWDEHQWPVDVARVPESALAHVRSVVEDAASRFEAPKFPPVAATDGDVRFVVRCVYEKTSCTPPGVLFSEPSAPFVPAPVFDPDAPARQMRVPMPVDTSKEALQKAKRGIGLMLSGELRRKMGMAHEGMLRDEDPRAGGPAIDLGVICSLSIPIVTICAMILLLIIATILHIIFRWLPFLFVCVPCKIEE